jgi:hypothetical protein
VAPVAVTAVSSRYRRCVTSRQKSSAGPVTRLTACSGSQVHTSPDGAQLDSDRLGRRVQSVSQVAEGPRADPDVRDVAEPVRRFPLRTDRIGDVLAVRPGLHQPRGERGGHAHRRAEPRHPRERIKAGEYREQFAVGAREPFAQQRSGQLPELGRDSIWLHPPSR